MSMVETANAANTINQWVAGLEIPIMAVQVGDEVENKVDYGDIPHLITQMTQDTEELE